MTTPLSIKYGKNIKNQDFLTDPEQKKILGYLERLYQEFSVHQSPNFINRFGQGLSNTQVLNPKGIYLWGGIGREKTYLMDIFYDSLSFPNKRRIHFHHFMREIYNHLRELGPCLDPLSHVAKTIGKDLRVLCLDELFVSDIGDATILSNFFLNLVKEHVTLVITSNTPPQDLYQGGFQRHRFLSTIELIKNHTQVLQLDGDIDYRITSKLQTNHYLEPHDHTTEAHLCEIFKNLTTGLSRNNTAIHINGRPIQAHAVSGGVIWCDFDNLCRVPISKFEFIELAHTYHTLLLSKIPLLGSEDDDAVRRFVELVDELYDRRVNLVASAMSKPETLYSGTRMDARFQRTASRLKEFQSIKYINEPHRP